jgi:hypothetical protein
MSEVKSRKLTVEDYVERLSNEEDAIDFLERHEICDVESIGNIEVYTKDKERGHIILDVFDGDHDYDILIDIKAGEPSIEQVHNAVYGMGIYCAERIIMYGGTNQNEAYGPAIREMVVGSLVECMNDYGSNISLVKMSDHEYRTLLFDLIVNDWSTPSRGRIQKSLPTLEQFRTAEFWNVYFDSLNTAFYEERNAFAGGISCDDKHGWYNESNQFRIELEWNDDGAFFTINQMKGEIDLLMSIWLNNKKELEKKFQNLNIQFAIPSNKLPKVTIKFWDFPIGCINNATTAEKISYARLLHSRLGDLVSFMGNFTN